MAKLAVTGLTIERAVRSLFPRGYRDYPAYMALLVDREGPAPDDDLAHPPCKATDLFAIAGFLLLRRKSVV